MFAVGLLRNIILNWIKWRNSTSYPKNKQQQKEQKTNENKNRRPDQMIWNAEIIDCTRKERRPRRTGTLFWTFLEPEINVPRGVYFHFQSEMKESHHFLSWKQYFHSHPFEVKYIFHFFINHIERAHCTWDSF